MLGTTELIELYHETGAAMAASIIKSQTIGSISAPYPAEFLPTKRHANFSKLGAFKGRGVLLRFEWAAKIEDVPESLIENCRAGILYRVYIHGTSDQNGFAGRRDAYWCSRIYPTTIQGLTLKEVSKALDVPEGDYSHVIDAVPVKDREINKMNKLIGSGLNIQVLPSPPDLSRKHLARSRKLVGTSGVLSFLDRYI